MGKTSLQKFAPISPLRNSLFLKCMPSLIFALVLAVFLFAPSRGHAVDTTPPAPATTSSAWNNLTPLQKQALAPLSKEWGSFSSDRKQKWLVFATKFQKMSPDDQKRALEKMDAWTKLTPEQRLAARENYIRSNKYQPEQRKQKWDEYNQLPEDEKAQLASHPEKKKLITNLPTPAESKETRLQPLKTPNKPASSTPVKSVSAASHQATSPAPASAPVTTVPTSAAPASAPPSTTN